MFDMLRNIFSFYRVTTTKKIVTTKGKNVHFLQLLKLESTWEDHLFT